VRCFVSRGNVGYGPGKLWCEGTAFLAEVPADRADPTAPIDSAPGLTAQRFLFVADYSVGIQSGKAVVGATIGLRYHPLELGFAFLDLQRNSFAPVENGIIGLGLTARGRMPLFSSRSDAIVGGTLATTSKNGTTNPAFQPLYQVFLGVAHQSSWRIFGTTQPWIQVRVGAADGPVTGDRVTALLDLHLGLSTPERR
jgi:hypothetical protein